MSVRPPPAVPVLENVREVVRLSELYLDGTVKLVIAQDTKAVALAGLMTTVSTALMAAGLSQLLAEPLPKRNIILGIAALGFALTLVGGLAYAILAARPRPVYVPGNYLNGWNTPEDLRGDLATALLGQARLYQSQIAENNAKLDEATAHMFTALKLLLVAPLVGLVLGAMAGAVLYDGFDVAL